MLKNDLLEEVIHSANAWLPLVDILRNYVANKI